MAASLPSKLVVFTGRGIPFDMQSGSMSEAPKGKIPYITLTEPAKTSDQQPSTLMMGDSTLITKHLIEAGQIADLNSRLSRTENAQDFAIRSMLEDRVFFYQVRERWVKLDNFYIMRDIGPLAPIPYPIRIFVGMLVYRKQERTLWGQGTGRLTDEEVDILLKDSWESIADLLQASRSKLKKKEAAESRPFWALGGDQPTEVDATIYGFLCAVFQCPANPNTEQIVRSHEVLVEYASRIHDTFFPDYTKWA